MGMVEIRPWTKFIYMYMYRRYFIVTLLVYLKPYICDRHTCGRKRATCTCTWKYFPWTNWSIFHRSDKDCCRTEAQLQRTQQNITPLPFFGVKRFSCKESTIEALLPTVTHKGVFLRSTFIHFPNSTQQMSCKIRSYFGRILAMCWNI